MRRAWAGLLVKVRDHQDRAAFAALFRHFAPRVKAFLMKSGAGAALAEECAQDVMAVLWQKAHLFDPARASVATWVYTIARNRRIDALRKARRAEPEELDWGPEPEPDQAEVLEAQQGQSGWGCVGRVARTAEDVDRTRLLRRPLAQRDRGRNGASPGDDQIADTAGAGEAAPPDGLKD